MELEIKDDAASSAGVHSVGGHSQFESPEDGSIDPASPGVKGKVEMDHFDDTGGSSALVPFVPVRGRGRGRGAQKKGVLRRRSLPHVQGAHGLAQILFV